MSLSNRDRRALERLEQQLIHDAPELIALFAPTGGQAGVGPSVRHRPRPPGLRARLSSPWKASTALGWAIGLQLLAAVVCMNTNSLLLVLAMLGVVVASVVPLVRAQGGNPRSHQERLK